MVPLIGIEEEYLIVDPRTRHVAPRAADVLAAATDVLDVARHAEATGWDGVYVADHFMVLPAMAPVDTPTLECATTVTALRSAGIVNSWPVPQAFATS